MAESGTTRSCTVEFLAAESFMIAFFAQKSCIVESCNAKSCMADILADKFHCGIVCSPYYTLLYNVCNPAAPKRAVFCMGPCDQGYWCRGNQDF